MQRKSTETKQLGGTHRPGRDPHEPLERLSAIPIAPDYLSPGALAEWDRIAPQCVLVGVTTCDLRALGLLAEALATETSLRAVIDAEGATVEAGGGGRKGHPALSALATCRTQAHKLMLDFGLIPRGRVALPPPPRGRRVNEFASL